MSEPTEAEWLEGNDPVTERERMEAAMTTDNRTNEPTEAMLDAAEKAYEDHWECGVRGDEFGERTCPFCGFLYQTQEDRKNRVQSAMDLMHARERHSLHAALVAAAGAAPQAPTARDAIQRLRDTAQLGRTGSAHEGVADWLEREFFGEGASPQAGSGSIAGAVVRTASGPCHIIYTAEGMSEEHMLGTHANAGEPSPEQVEAAAEGMWDRYGDRGLFPHAAEHLRSAFRKDARAALVAAAGVAPQAESDDDYVDPEECPACDTPLDKCDRDDVCCWDCNHADCWPPVQPSSTVDEITKVIRSAKVAQVISEDGTVGPGHASSHDIARAVVEAIGGESR